MNPSTRTYLDLSFCERRGLDGFIATVDQIVDRSTPSDEPLWGDSETAAELSAGTSTSF